MINVNELWKKRFVQNSQETRKYLRYMLNDHLLFVLLFILGGGAFYYQDWVDSLSSEFPYVFVITLLLSIVLTNSPIRTFLKAADIAFLLQLESKLNKYFKKSILYSLMMQTYWIILVFVAVLPIYSKFTNVSFLLIMAYLSLMIMIKLWNLLLKWKIQYYEDSKIHNSDTIVRFTLNFTFLYFLFSKANIFFLVSIGLIMLLLFAYFNRIVYQKNLKWEYLIDQEERRLMLFLRVANLFTDVPKLRDRVKRRKWLDWVLSFVKYSKNNTFMYLYFRTFLRTSDYFGLYVRLTIIGGLLIYIAPFYYGKIVVVLLFIYLTGFQLMTLWKHHDMKIWVSLYPVSSQIRLKSFVQLLLILLVVQTGLFSIVLFSYEKLILGILTLLFGVIFSFVFSSFYIQRKIKI